jgi:hypothetical protein
MTVVADRSQWTVTRLLAERSREMDDRTLATFGIGEATLGYREAEELSGRVDKRIAFFAMRFRRFLFSAWRTALIAEW